VHYGSGLAKGSSVTISLFLGCVVHRARRSDAAKVRAHSYERADAAFEDGMA